jgi:hypothetical protein
MDDHRPATTPIKLRLVSYTEQSDVAQTKEKLFLIHFGGNTFSTGAENGKKLF